MSALTTGLATAVAAGVATVAHELTHAGVAMLLGRFERFDVRSWEVLYHIRNPPGWRGYAVAGAPMFVGMLLAPLALVVDVTLPVVMGWGIYTFLGAATNDFEFRTLETA